MENMQPDSRIDDWDDYFMKLAETVARKSKDPRCPVGALVASADRLVLSTGFNGLARGILDDTELLHNAAQKLSVICHAEFNAIVNAARVGVSLRGASIYVTKFPCLACCNAIIQAGIGEIHTDDHRFWDDDPLDQEAEGFRRHDRKRFLLRQANIRVVADSHPEYSRLAPPRSDVA